MNYYGKFRANYFDGFWGVIGGVLAVFYEAALSSRPFARQSPGEAVLDPLAAASATARAAACPRPRSTASAVAREEAVQ